MAPRESAGDGDRPRAPDAPDSRDPRHWLHRHDAEGWLAGALRELERASAAFEGRDAQGGLAAVKRAAGMALNAALVVRPREGWGRTYIEHLEGLAQEERAPAEVRAAAAALLAVPLPRPGFALLRTRAADERLLEAARTVMAHAWAIVHGAKTRAET
jgi:HEPN domain-containing protein